MEGSWLANPAATRRVLESFGIGAKHRLGQNFLVSDAVVRRILELAQLDGCDVVYEVGPGIGTLTVALLAQAGAVCAVEADASLVPVLRENTAEAAGRLALVVGDALKVDAPTLEQAVCTLGLEGLGPAPTKLVANLPYQVAATLILDVLEGMPGIGRLVVMVQAEVADRICAAPGSKAYGAYTAKLGLYGQVTGRFSVGRECFLPAPHVDSAVVRIDRHPAGTTFGGHALSAVASGCVATVIDAAFAQRRKTIRNSMASQGFDKEALDGAFAEAGIAPTVRGETLALEDFVRLAAALGAGNPEACLALARPGRGGA